jgi:hypothetical protein
MNDQHPFVGYSKRRWDQEDASRDAEEKRRRRLFLEEDATQIFSVIEDYFIRLGRVLSEAGGSVEIKQWEHLGHHTLRRVAQVTPSDPTQQLSLEFTILGVTIFYRDNPYRFAAGNTALVSAITTEIERFLTPHMLLPPSSRDDAATLSAKARSVPPRAAPAGKFQAVSSYA